MKAKEARRLLAERERLREKAAEANRRFEAARDLADSARGVEWEEGQKVSALESDLADLNARVARLLDEVSVCKARLLEAELMRATSDAAVVEAQKRRELAAARASDPRFAEAEARLAQVEEHAKREAERLLAAAGAKPEALSPEAAEGLAFLRRVFSGARGLERRRR